ncbi:hypothetical protein T492DRAFT_892528 [Pavlovales sp. CCMP2436]|nr:hypothetical protein T492DRAFT_892528 [Pavlovales sp. CCMP2436]
MRNLLNSTQVAVMNIGVHYAVSQSKQWDAQLQQLLTLMGEWQVAQPTRTAVFLETTAQHFSPFGHCMPQHRLRKMGIHGVQQNGNKINGTCECGMPAEVEQTNWVARQNQQAAHLAWRLGVRVAPTYNMTLRMPTWHRGHGVAAVKANDCDCTHYRINREAVQWLSTA